MERKFAANDLDPGSFCAPEVESLHEDLWAHIGNVCYPPLGHLNPLSAEYYDDLSPRDAGYYVLIS